MRKPVDINELRSFYLNEYRPLYDRFSTLYDDGVPVELHLEVASAFDHLLRHTSRNGKIDQNDFERVVGHLKRATFDAFKVLYVEGIRKPYNRLSQGCYSNVEDGKFQPRILDMKNKAEEIAATARSYEHLSDAVNPEAWGFAFDEWKKIIPIADQFRQEEKSEKIRRVAQYDRLLTIKGWGLNFFWAAVGAALSTLFAKFFS